MAWDRDLLLLCCYVCQARYRGCLRRLLTIPEERAKSELKGMRSELLASRLYLVEGLIGGWCEINIGCFGSKSSKEWSGKRQLRRSHRRRINCLAQVGIRHFGAKRKTDQGNCQQQRKTRVRELIKETGKEHLDYIRDAENEVQKFTENTMYYDKFDKWWQTGKFW